MDEIKVSLDALTLRVNRITGRKYTRTTISTARNGGKGSLALKEAIRKATAAILAKAGRK